jgi:hypothetical protein
MVTTKQARIFTKDKYNHLKNLYVVDDFQLKKNFFLEKTQFFETRGNFEVGAASFCQLAIFPTTY